jgi:hypothetical protein
MEHKLTFYPKQHLVVASTRGVATIEGFEAFANDLLGHANWVPGMTLLADHRDLTFSELATFDVEKFRRFMSKSFGVL